MDTVEGLTEKLEKKRERIRDLEFDNEAQRCQIQQQQAEMKQLLSLVARRGNRQFLWCIHCTKPTIDKEIHTCVECFASLPCQEWCKNVYPVNREEEIIGGKNVPKRCYECKKYFCSECARNVIRVCSKCFNK